MKAKLKKQIEEIKKVTKLEEYYYPESQFFGISLKHFNKKDLIGIIYYCHKNSSLFKK